MKIILILCSLLFCTCVNKNSEKNAFQIIDPSYNGCNEIPDSTKNRYLLEMKWLRCSDKLKYHKYSRIDGKPEEIKANLIFNNLFRIDFNDYSKFNYNKIDSFISEGDLKYEKLIFDTLHFSKDEYKNAATEIVFCLNRLSSYQYIKEKHNSDDISQSVQITYNIEFLDSLITLKTQTLLEDNVFQYLTDKEEQDNVSVFLNTGSNYFLDDNLSRLGLFSKEGEFETPFTHVVYNKTKNRINTYLLPHSIRYGIEGRSNNYRGNAKYYRINKLLETKELVSTKNLLFSKEQQPSPKDPVEKMFAENESWNRDRYVCFQLISDSRHEVLLAYLFMILDRINESSKRHKFE